MELNGLVLVNLLHALKILQGGNTVAHVLAVS